MLDTDTSSYLLKGRFPGIAAQMDRLAAERLCVSMVTRAELLVAAELGNARLTRPVVTAYLSRVRVLPWDEAASDHYAPLAARFHRSGVSIGDLDILIAAHALSVNAVLVTNNQKHFSRVPGLALENWTQPN